MRSNTHRFVRGLVLAIAASALAAAAASVAPAAASVDREATSATPRIVQEGGHPGIVLRRDGAQAVPFVADVGPPKAPATSDGFDWGDAGIGATAMLALGAIAAGAGFVLGRRPSRSHTPRSATAILGGRG